MDARKLKRSVTYQIDGVDDHQYHRWWLSCFPTAMTVRFVGTAGEQLFVDVRYLEQPHEHAPRHLRYRPT